MEKKENDKNSMQPPTTSCDSTKSLDEVFREYAMGYFEVHAEQRLKAFQFFISLSTALVGGYLLLLRGSPGHKWMGVLGVLLCFLSFVFWKLDVRTRRLVKNAEDALSFLDAQHNLSDIDGKPHPLRLFSRDKHNTETAPLFPLKDGHFSYSRSFKYVYVVFAWIGIISAICSVSLFPK